MKILFVCRSFNNMAGGVERMAAALMNEMTKRGHSVSLLTWDLAGAKAFYDFDSRIEWFNLDMGSHMQKAGWTLRLRRMLKMRALLKEIDSDVILAFQHGTFLATRLYSLGQGYPVIAAEREAPARFKHIKAGKWQNLIYQSFRLAEKITIQCESYRKNYPAYLSQKIVTISNPVFPAKCFADSAGKSVRQKILLCAGRLSYQKNQSVLIHAFSKIYKDCLDWNLHLVGEGEDRQTLENLIRMLNLGERILLKGALKDMHGVYCTSHLLCLPARWEGFPNVIAESLAHGLPAVGFEDCAGTRDLIQDGYNGALAVGNNNADSLALTLKTLMQNDDLREEMGKNGILSMQPFVPDLIFNQWEALFKDVSKR